MRSVVGNHARMANIGGKHQNQDAHYPLLVSGRQLSTYLLLHKLEYDHYD
jgi:hypothetical protein